MKKNMGMTDRYIRLAAAALIAILYFMNIISGTWAVVGLIVVGIFVITSMISFCPIYSLIGVKTCKTE